MGGHFGRAFLGAALAVALTASFVAAKAAEDVPDGVTLQKQGHGWSLADAKGMTLYVFARDKTPGKSACNAACAKLWPPVVAAADAKAGNDWSKITRDDGVSQWTYRGQPLYAYSRDVHPGDLNGDEVNGVWSVAFKQIFTPAGFTVVRTLVGYVLADQAHMTLYASDTDTGRKTPGCDAACMRSWKPVEAPWTAKGDGDWTIVKRDDGTHQWAYKNHPLYRFGSDVEIAETSGEAFDKKWHALVLEPPPPVPGWVQVQASDAGNLYSDANGQTLYAHDPNGARGLGALAGDGILRPQDWKPVLAAANDKPIGSWSIIEQKDGARQWAYRGMLLYINVLDKVPGELRGIRRPDHTWKTIMQSGKPMDGTGA